MVGFNLSKLAVLQTSHGPTPPIVELSSCSLQHRFQSKLNIFESEYILHTILTFGFIHTLDVATAVEINRMTHF